MDTKSNKYIDLTIDPDKDFGKYRIVEFKEIKVRFTTPEELILKKQMLYHQTQHEQAVWVPNCIGE